MLQKSTYNLLGSCNFKWLRVAETAHPTTIARLIGRSVFGGMVCINFLRGEISTANLSKLVCAIRQENFVIALWRGRCDSPRQGAGLPDYPFFSWLCVCPRPYITRFCLSLHPPLAVLLTVFRPLCSCSLAA